MKKLLLLSLLFIIFSCEEETNTIKTENTNTKDAQPPKAEKASRLLTLEERVNIGSEWKEDSRYMTCGGTPIGDGGFDNVNCFYYSIDNLHDFAAAHLWAEHKDSTGKKYRAPTGAESDCEPPLTQKRVPCWIHTTDKNFNKLEMVHLVCKGHRRCTKDEPNCCKVLSRKPMYEPFEE